MQKTTNTLTIAAVSLAAAASFGVGAAALAQGGVEFNPANFDSAYTRGADGVDEGYRANRTSVDAEANRQSDNGEDADKTAGSKGIDDAFSQMPINGESGTMAYNFTDNSSTGVLVSTGGNANASANGEGLSAGAIIGEGGNSGESTGGSTTDNNGNAGGNNGNAGNNGGSDTPAPAPWSDYEPSQPEQKPSGLVPATPASPNIPTLDAITGENYESLLGDDCIRVAIQKNLLNSDVALYKGQTLDKWTVFCALASQFGFRPSPDASWEWYDWTCSRDEFEAYSQTMFDIVDYPKGKIDKDVISITVKFRLGKNDAWHYQTIEYQVEQSCLMILDSPDFANNSLLERSVDQRTFLFSKNENALRKAGALRDDGTLSKLLLNWTVDGEDTGFVYDAITPGRHVATPGKFVDLPSYYHAECDAFYLNDSLEVDASGTYSILQTLTGVEEDSPAFITDAEGESTLVIPNGIQAMNVDFFSPIYANKVVLPASFLAMDSESNCLFVGESYSVSKDNPVFAATEDGILTNKSGDEYKALPVGLTDLDIPEQIKSVELPNWNLIQHIRLHGSDASALPSLDLTKLDQCNIELDDDAFYDFILGNYEALNGEGGLTLSIASNPSEEYHLDHNMLRSDDTLYHVFASLDSSIEVSGVSAIAPHAFSEAASIQTVQLSGEGEYVLEDGCFEGGNIQLIVCNTQQQFDYVKSRLDASGAPSAQVALSQVGQDGFSYYAVSDDGVESITLTHAPADATVFGGTILSASGEELAVDAIGPRAFAGCENLEWVYLGEKTWDIGASAFEGCENLEGLFIANPDYIRVGSNALVGCANMQFVASRAYYGDFATWDYLGEGCSMYCPTNNVGYTGYFVCFNEESNINDYDVVQQEDGGLVLCGSSYNDDGGKRRWLVLGSGRSLSGEIVLPEETVEIFSGAFANTGGEFTINWEDLTNLTYIDSNAFSGSGLSGEVRLGAAGVAAGGRMSVASYAFDSCPEIASVSIESAYANVGPSAFSNCGGLTSLSIASGYDYMADWYLSAGFLSNCREDVTISFTNQNPIKLVPVEEGSGYVFDGWHYGPEEEANIRLDIPEEYRDAYIQKWAYYFAGFDSYDSMYEVLYRKLWAELNYKRVPTEIEVQNRMSQLLLVAENHMRTMMRIPSVEVSSVLPIFTTDDGYVFVEKDGKPTLSAVPTDASVIDLNTAIPDDMNGVAIGASVFEQCSNLQRIVMSNKVSSIANNAFAGCDNVEVEFPIASQWEIPTLEADYSSFPAEFTFGSNIKLLLPTESADDYLKYWTWGKSGYTSEDDLYFLVLMFYAGSEMTAEEVNGIINEPFLEFENYLRGLAGMPKAGAVEELSSFYDTSMALGEFALSGKNNGEGPIKVEVGDSQGAIEEESVVIGDGGNHNGADSVEGQSDADGLPSGEKPSGDKESFVGGMLAAESTGVKSNAAPAEDAQQAARQE